MMMMVFPDEGTTWLFSESLAWTVVAEAWFIGEAWRN
jgi:hypothetical protein